MAQVGVRDLTVVFDWDEEKARKNINKHSVSFDEAASVLVPVLLLARSAEFMSQIAEMDDELLPEYDLTKLQLVARGPGRKSASVDIKLEPDVAELFPDSGAVNEGLRLLTRLLNRASVRELN